MASKKSRTKKQLERLKKKRARKATQQALYASYKAAGKNKKSARFRRNQKKNALIANYDHPHGACGNIGCEKCSGISFRPFLKKAAGSKYVIRQPHNMPRKMYVKWIKLPAKQKLDEMQKLHLDMFR